MNEKTYVEIQGVDYFFKSHPDAEVDDKYRVRLCRTLVNGELEGFVVKSGDAILRTFTCFQLGLATLYYEGFVAALKHLDLD